MRPFCPFPDPLRWRNGDRVEQHLSFTVTADTNAFAAAVRSFSTASQRIDALLGRLSHSDTRYDRDGDSWQVITEWPDLQRVP